LFAKDVFADRTNGRAYASVASVRRFLSVTVSRAKRCVC